MKDDKSNTVEVLVPKVAVVVRDEVSDVVVADGDVAKRAALQKEAAAASIVAEDFARRFESGEAVVRGCFFLALVLVLLICVKMWLELCEFDAIVSKFDASDR